jgi:hypothetical protein
MLRFLITSRPDVGKLTSMTGEKTPMLQAAYQGHIEVMQLLVEHGADVSGRAGRPWSGAPYGRTPLTAAVQGKDREAVAWLLSQGAEAGPALKEIVLYEGAEGVRLLVGCGVDVKAHGPRALLAALSSRFTKTAVALLELGTPTDSHSFRQAGGFQETGRFVAWLERKLGRVPDEQKKALHQAAVEYGHTEFAGLLAQAGIARSQAGADVPSASLV